MLIVDYTLLLSFFAILYFTGIDGGCGDRECTIYEIGHRFQGRIHV